MKDDEITLSVVDEDSPPRSVTTFPETYSVFSSMKSLSSPDSTQSFTARKTHADVHDVAAFILQQRGEMTAMKLQKLVYYSQAWSLVWDEEPLFSEDMEAWANGPVVRALYARHQGQFKVKEWSGDPAKLTESQRDTILKVLEYYGGMPSQVLSELTHQEDPWVNARAGLSVGIRGNRIISHAALAEYYSSL